MTQLSTLIPLSTPNVPNVLIASDSFTAIAGQTQFGLSRTPKSEVYTLVTRNGLLLTPTTHYTISGAALTLTFSASLNDIVVCKHFVVDIVPVGTFNSVTTPLAYNSSTGILTVGSGSTVVAGTLQLNDSTSSTSVTTAATPNSVKTAYDLATTANTAASTANTLATAALPKAGGAITGTLKSVVYTETRVNPSISTNVLTLDCSTGNVFDVSLNANITTLTFTNAPTTGTAYALTLILTADGTARTVTWGAAVKWASGTAPTLTSTSTKQDIVVLVTRDAGTTWLAVLAGQNL